MSYETRRTSPTRFASFLAVVLMLAACGSPSVPTIVGYKLSGTVMLQTPNGLIPGSHVSVQGPSTRHSAITDARGRYSMYGLAAGVAHVRIDFNVFETIDQDIPIAADTVADFQLIPRPLFALSGRITEMTALGPVPVSDVLVEVFVCSRPNGSRVLKDAVTDADGAYRIAGLCEGPAIVFVLKPGYTYTSPNTPHCDDGHGTECRWTTIAGDTRFDQVLVRK